VKATQAGRWGKVKALQWMLTHSFSGKALAVNRVTENKGKHTAGVDGAIWQSPGAKYKAIGKLRRNGYPTMVRMRVRTRRSFGWAAGRTPGAASSKRSRSIPGWRGRRCA